MPNKQRLRTAKRILINLHNLNRNYNFNNYIVMVTQLETEANEVLHLEHNFIWC